MKKRILAAVMAVCLMAQTAGLAVLPVNAQTITEKAEEVIPASAAEEQQMEPEEGNVNFVYLEEENVSLPGEQKILVSVGADETQIVSADLYYHKTETGENLQIAAGEFSGNALLFSIPYTEEAQTGGYVLDKVVYTDTQKKSFFVDLTAEKEITYGVNRDVETNPDALILDDEIEMNVVTFDAEGNQESELSISEALGNAGNSQNRAAANGRAMASSGMVIVLDPGHGGSDPGATRSYNGINYYERDIVLKIAQYCKTELETYRGVKVYMTRTDNTSALMDRRQRTDFALSKGADVVISFHINSTGEQVTTASGSLVYCPNNDTASGEVSQQLARKILEKLEVLGLKNRGIVLNEELGMIIYPKESGLPGILIEHAFVNNPGDVTNYLSSDDKLKKLGVADATAIAEYYKLKKGSDYQTYTAGSGSVTVKANKAKTQYTVTVSKAPKAYGVRYAVWSEENGQDDLKWYNAKLKEGDWKGSFQISSFKKTGAYHIHAYIVNMDGSTVIAGVSTITVKGPSLEKASVKKANPVAGTFQAVLTGVTSDSAVTKVQVKAWPQSNKKASKVYTAKLQSDGTYRANINIKYHNYSYEKYNLQVYVTDSNGIKKRVKSFTKSFRRPASELKVKLNSRQTKGSITINGSAETTSVRAAVWSKTKGQDDLRWYTLKKGKDGKWNTSFNISKHKTRGDYYVHVYKTTKSGTTALVDGTVFKVQGPKIKSMTSTRVNGSTGTFYVYLKGVTAKAGIKKVTVKAWTKSNKSDIHTYEAKETAVGTYRVKINVKNHEYNYGNYQLRAYVTDNTGIVVQKSMVQSLVK